MLNLIWTTLKWTEEKQLKRRTNGFLRLHGKLQTKVDIFMNENSIMTLLARPTYNGYIMTCLTSKITPTNVWCY